MTLMVLAAQPAKANDWDEIAAVVNTYVQAIYARDFRAAYENIASADRSLKDVHTYSRERGEFRDFILDAARAVAQAVAVIMLEHRVEKTNASVKVRVKVPDAAKLNSLLHDWDGERLERLSPGERQTLLAAIESQRREGKIAMSESVETFNLVRQADGWKVFLHWAAGVKLTFQPAVAATTPVEIRIEQKEVLSRPGQIFRVAMTVKNLGKQALTARIGHLIEPQEVRDYLDLVDCGFILPVRLSAGKEEHFITTYLLRGTLPDQVRRLSITYAVSASAPEQSKP